MCVGVRMQCVCTYVYTSVCVHACMCAHVCVCVCVFVCVCGLPLSLGLAAHRVDVNTPGGTGYLGSEVGT